MMTLEVDDEERACYGIIETHRENRLKYLGACQDDQRTR
jgi:hypothetical protein